MNNPPYIAVSDNYMGFLRSGLVSVSSGKLESLSGSTAIVSPSQENIADIAAVVLATGFEAASSLSYLPDSLRNILAFDSDNLNNTVALAFHGTHHPDIPNLGFVGFYRSPYWGVMEMQARFLSALWTHGGLKSSALPQSIATALEEDTSIQRTLALRKDPRSSQFPMGDYSWLMQEFSQALGLELSPPRGMLFVDTPDAPETATLFDVLVPARYPLKDLAPSDQEEVMQSLDQMKSAVCGAVGKGANLAKAVFRGLQGKWTLERNVTSRLLSHPSGVFKGTAEFILREGTVDGREESKVGENTDAGLEYLYIEDGEFTATNGMNFRATRRYVWRYDGKTDKLSVWFVKTDDRKRADYLFHKIDFEWENNTGATNGVSTALSTNVLTNDIADHFGAGWKAKADHLCVQDFYDAKYEFVFKAVVLLGFLQTYTVKGPNKDYTITNTYRWRSPDNPS
jgi:hypothetical protein